MSKDLYRYIYNDLKNPDNNCVLVTLKQLSERSGMPYIAVRRIFKDKNMYYDPDGEFRLERRVYIKAKLKGRRNLNMNRNGNI